MKRVDPYYLTPEWEALRRQVLKRDNYLCSFCGVKCLGKKRNKPSPHVDHIIPRKEGGKDTLDNLRVACHSCHSRITILDRYSKGKPEIGLDGYIIE